MKAESVNIRLCRIAEAYGLSVSDLSLLLGCSRSTVGQWVKRGVVPLAHRQAQIAARMNHLEKTWKKYFPVPLSVNQFRRRDYLKGVVNGVPPKLLLKNLSAGR